MQMTTEKRMSKPEVPAKNTPLAASISPLPDTTTSAATDSTITQSFLLLKTGAAKKLGKQAEGSINYRVLGDVDRKHLHLSITGNDGGGYFSKELVSFHKVEGCIAQREREKPFPSKPFKEVFVGRSSNNAGFLAAILRTEGLLAAAPDLETQHVTSGDWEAWKKSLLVEPGETIEIESVKPADKHAEPGSPSDHMEHTETRKTITVKRPKPEIKTHLPDKQDT
jgi:hypothetical protein